MKLYDLMIFSVSTMSVILFKVKSDNVIIKIYRKDKRFTRPNKNTKLLSQFFIVGSSQDSGLYFINILLYLI